MKATFVETAPFARIRADYLTDDDYRELQEALLNEPRIGDTIAGTGGLRKVRWVLSGSSKGKRGGIRVIYYWWSETGRFLMFTLYAKGEAVDLSSDEKKQFKNMLQSLLAEIGD